MDSFFSNQFSLNSWGLVPFVNLASGLEKKKIIIIRLPACPFGQAALTFLLNTDPGKKGSNVFCYGAIRFPVT